MLTRIIVTALMTMMLIIFHPHGWLSLLLYVIAYLIIGYDILRKALLGIIRGEYPMKTFSWQLPQSGHSHWRYMTSREIISKR